MIHANRGWSIIEYEKGEDFIETKGGLYIAAGRTQRAMMKSGAKHTIGADPDVDIPDLVRFGTLIAGDGIFKVGAQVLFNKHDAFGFELDDKHYYAIKTEFIIGGVDGEKV